MEAILLILGPVFMATITPGPSMLLAMDHGLRFGARGTLPTALGNVAATMVQAAISLAGLRLVALGSTHVMHAVRLAGALYLGYLGVRMMWIAKAPGSTARQSLAGITRFQRLRQAFFVTLWNPTAYLFFAAVFPPFLAAPSGIILLVLGLLLPTLVITFTCMMFYARFGQALVQFLGEPGRAKAFRVALGLSFVGLGVWTGVRV